MKGATMVLLASFAALFAWGSAGPAPAGAGNQPEGPDRSGPPEAGPLPAFQVPIPQRFSLSNGLLVLFIERDKVPLVDVALAVRSGASSDPAKIPGVADWTAAMLTEGAAGKGALELADQVDFLGATLSANAEWEASAIRLHVASARLEPGLGLMADVLLRPDFPQAEWDRLCENRKTAFLQARDDPRSLGRIARARAAFGISHRYGTSLEGTPASLKRVKLEDLRAFHRTCYRPDNAFLVVVGDVRREALLPLLEKAFGEWRAPDSPLPAPKVAMAQPLAKREIILVDKPGAAQSVIGAVAIAPRELQPLDPPNEVMNTLLGGSFASRLNNNLREEHGYTYGARSFFDLRPFGSGFTAASSVATDVTGPALREVLNELDRIRTPATEKEVIRARRYLALNFPSRFETGADVAYLWGWAELRGIKESRIASYMGDAESVDGAALLAAAMRDVDPQRMRLVVVGDRAKVEKPLKELGFGPLTVWTISDLLGPAPARSRD